MDIITIRSGGVHCYLIKTGSGFILVDSGFPDKRQRLLHDLENNGCKPGNLKLVIITHADSDHAGNARYLQENFRVSIAMHRLEAQAAQSGYSGDSRASKKGIPGLLQKSILSLFIMKESDRFKPDVFVEEGFDLSGYGVKAKIIDLPGHSRGSIGVLTNKGDLFCGDLLINFNKPAPHFGIDSREDLLSSIEKLKKLDVGTVYPGHGKPFQFRQFLKSREGIEYVYK